MWAGSRIVVVVLIERVADRLLDPVAGVGAEASAEPRVVFLGGADESQVPLTDEVVDRDAPPDVIPGDLDHQPQVGLDEPPLCAGVAPGNRHRQAALLR